MGQKEGFFEKKPSAATVRLAMEKQMAKVGQLRRWKVSFMPKVIPLLFGIKSARQKGQAILASAIEHLVLRAPATIG